MERKHGGAAVAGRWASYALGLGIAVALLAPGRALAEDDGAADVGTETPGAGAPGAAAPGATEEDRVEWLPARDDARWGVELSASWPIIPGGLAGAATVTLWARGPFRGELVVGAQWDWPQDREDEGRFSHLGALIGYRQFFIRGLHLELGVLPGVGFLEGSPWTGRDYTSFDLELAGMLGYRLDVVRIGGATLYANLQGGVRYVAYKSNPWPFDQDGSTEETPIPVGNLALGVRFSTVR